MQESDRQAQTKDQVPVLNGARILLAEDTKDSQLLIAYILKAAGAQVSVAGNGRIAIEVFTEAQALGEPFDLILMDIQMPELDGYGATQALRQQGESVPIIALTASSSAEDREKCLGVGCNAFTSKPVDRKDLVALIKKTLCPDPE